MNRITVEGRVAGEPRTGTTAKGIAYTSFSLADYQGKEYGVQYINVFVSGKMVEWVKLEKGTCISVHGKLSLKKDEKYGVQATVFVERLTNWNEEVNRFSDDSKSTAADDVDIPF